MLDRIFAVIGMLGLIAFMGIVAVYVMEPDLWLVAFVGVFIAVFFVWREAAAAAGNPPSSGRRVD